MKNILYVLDRFPKLSETFVLNEIIELIDRGLDIQILSLHNPYDKSVNEDVLNYDLLNKTTYFGQPSPAVFKHLFSPLLYVYIVKTLKNIPINRHWPSMIPCAYYSAVYRKIDLVHAHFAHNAAVKAMVIAKILKKPFTFTAHAFEIFQFPLYSRKRLKMLVENANMVITPSEYNKTHILKETDCENGKIETIRATINADKFIKTQKVDRKDNAINILSVGRLVEKKGGQYLIKAMKTVVRRFPEARLSIIGTGELEKDLMKLAYDLGLANSVTFLGEQPNERCVGELSICDMAVLPCVVAADGDRDVCPLTLQEAMAMESPVISTNVGSVPELIDHGINGLLVPEKDEKALAGAIIELIENPLLRTRMGRKGREKILNEFNIKKQAGRLLATWENM